MQIVLLAVVQVLGLTVWFSATAISPALQVEWEIGPVSAVWITASVQVGFVVGGVFSALFTLGDRFRPQKIMAIAALGASATTAAMALFAENLGTAVVIRFLTGIFLAGIYPIGMKVMASWAPQSRRGVAMGLLLGALTIGSAMPHLLTGLSNLPWRQVMLGAAVITAAAALVAILGVRLGPHLETRPARPKIRHAWVGFKTRRGMLANLAYFGHMWELYALWTWLPMFLIVSRESEFNGEGSDWIGVVSFISIGIAGLLGALLGGWLADKIGRSRAAGAALVTSGLCCLVSPFVFSASWIFVIIILVVWGASVIADSGVFSTSLSESVDPRYVGTALTTQTTLGFLTTVVSIQLIPLVATAVGWEWAFLVLLPGPIVGVIAMIFQRSEGLKKDVLTTNKNPVKAITSPVVHSSDK